MANYLSVNLELQKEKECVKMITVILIIRMVKIKAKNQNLGHLIYPLLRASYYIDCEVDHRFKEFLSIREGWFYIINNFE